MAISLTLVGCAATPPAVTLQLQPTGKRLIERFTHAYAGTDSSGDDRVVLVRDPLAQAPASAPDAVLSPVPVPLRQILTLRLLYRPMPGARGDSPASTNAALHWFVLGNPAAGVNGLLQYEGTGFVSIRIERHDDQITVRNATLSLVQKQGELVDPLHTFTVNADFTATRDPAALAAVLDEIKTTEHPPAAPPPATQSAPLELPTTLPTP